MTAVSALLIPVDPQQPMRRVSFDSNDGLEAIQAHVGGPFQALPVRHLGCDFFLNEEGKLYGGAPNLRATLAARILPHDVLVGDVLAVGAPDVEGESTSLTAEQEARVIESARA